VCSLDFIFCITGAGASTCLCVYMWLFVIFIYTVCLYLYNGSTSYMRYLQSVCILLVNRAVRGCGPVCAVAFYKCDVGNACWLMIAFITCNSHLVPLLEGLCSSNPGSFEFSVSVCASVELLGVWRTDTAGVGVGIPIFVSVSLFLSVYVWSFIYIYVFQLVSDEPPGLVWIRVTHR